MRLTWATTVVALLLTSVVADDIFCDKSTPCETGCCGSNNVCGTGPNYCSKAKCINSCTYKAECNPGDWDSQYVNATKCPLNVCCSKFGFCGTTEEFCGKETVKRPSCGIASQQVKRVIGYYGSGGASRSCNSMVPSSFPQGIYTHIYFAFGSIDPKTFQVVPSNKQDEKLYRQLGALKTRDIGQELWLSIGGWTFSDDGSPTATTFSDLVNADETYQMVFFASLTLFMQTWGFTGIDIDWEYPVATDRNGRESDFRAYPKFLKRLKSALNDYKYGLSVTLPTSYWYLQHFDLENIEPSVDWFNFMSYDLHGAWDIGNKWTGAFVGAHTNLTEIKSSLDLLWRNKVSPSKVVLGLAFYGRAVTLASSSCSEPGCAYLSAADAGECSGEAGILFNSEISQLISDKKLKPKLYKDAAIKTIQWNDDQWVSYDDKDTWKLKANFLKSQCLSGILVWAVDYDDDQHSYSKGLAAAMGIKINVDIDTGSTIKLPDKKDESNDFCYFTNCGQTCPSGYTEIIRDDDKSQLMLDSTQCPPGYGQTQTLCCPKSSKVPTCRWRGFHNSGKCEVGCNPGEVEVGTTAKGCKRSGWQSACCDMTETVEPWSKCKWTDECFEDNTCPKGYSSFVVGSREGWSGRRSCKKGLYNYCCTETPKPFKNCEWVGHEVSFTNTNFCSDACPHGSTRIAEQQIETSWNSIKVANAKDCNYGAEAYCCSGDKESDKDQRDTGTRLSEVAEEFDEYLSKFLRDPLCPADWESQYSANDGMFARDFLRSRATDQSAVLDQLVPITEAWLTARKPSEELEMVWNKRMEQYGYGDSVANVSTFQDLMYQGRWSDQTLYPSTLVVVETFCNLGTSRDAMDNMAFASEALCEIPSTSTGPGSDKRHLLETRALDELTMGVRSGDQQRPSVAEALRGVSNGQLSLHYMRWLQSSPPSGTRIPDQVLLEAAFWIGDDPGVAPEQAIRDRYSDRLHDRVARDRWVVFHFHIPLNTGTFMADADGWYPGVSTFSMYHSQDYMSPTGVDFAHPDYRAEFRYTDSYIRGRDNTGTMTNFNTRAQPFNCRGTTSGDVWYMGYDYTGRVRDLAHRGTINGRTRPSALAGLVNGLGIRLRDEGTFSRDNLRYIWPTIEDSDLPTSTSRPNWRDQYNPEQGAFDENWLPGGNGPKDLSQADN